MNIYHLRSTFAADQYKKKYGGNGMVAKENSNNNKNSQRQTDKICTIYNIQRNILFFYLSTDTQLH